MKELKSNKSSAGSQISHRSYKKNEFYGYRMNTDSNSQGPIKEKYDLRELRDIKTIRQITKGTYKDLGILINDRKGTIPIFGYPLICYSPNETP